VSAIDSNKDGELDAAEFVHYLHEHEMKLQLMFRRIDRDKDGKIFLFIQRTCFAKASIH